MGKGHFRLVLKDEEQLWSECDILVKTFLKVIENDASS